MPLFQSYEINDSNCGGYPRYMQFSTILGIESSCDDTAAAIWQNGKILANIAAGQKVHETYGGVVPELASRAHMSNIIPVIHTALSESGKKANDLDAIAYTQGPGLMGSLLVGIHAAKGLSIALGIPLMGVNHLQAHIAAIYIEYPKPEFPILCLLASGGHTRLILVKDYMQMEVIGGTIDDAAGEAFDKAAKLLGLAYPGGPHIDRLAAKGNPLAFNFPDAKVPDLDFSFSGIKTSLLYFVRDHLKEKPDFIEKNLEDICASFQHCVIRYLLSKTQKAIDIYKPSSIALAGGVSANSQLRKQFVFLAQTNATNFYIPSFEYCTDNAAMIASAGHYLLASGAVSNLNALPFSR